MIIKGKVEEMLPHVDTTREITVLADLINAITVLADLTKATTVHVVTSRETIAHVDTTTTTGVLKGPTTEMRVPVDTIHETTHVEITRPSTSLGLTMKEIQEDMRLVMTHAAKTSQKATSLGTKIKNTPKAAKQKQALVRMINSITKAGVTGRPMPTS